MTSINDWMATIETAIHLQDKLINEPGIRGIDTITNQTWKQVHISKGIEKIAAAIGTPLSECEQDENYKRSYVVHNGIEYFQLIPVAKGGVQDVA